MTYPGTTPAMPQAERPTLAGPTGGGDSVAMRNLDGRTVMLIVTGHNPNDTYEGDPRPSITADLYVLDGGPLTYGDRVRPAVTPPTKSVSTPAYFVGVKLTGPVVDSAKAYVGTNQPVGGRVVRGTKGQKGNPPWLLVNLGTELDPRRAEAGQLSEQLIDLLVAHRSRQWTPPTPTDLIQSGPPQAAPTGYAPTQQVHYGPPMPPQQPTAPSLPQVPQLPKLPPAAPVNEGWNSKLEQFGWTAESWQQAYPTMPGDQRTQWAALAGQ